MRRYILVLAAAAALPLLAPTQASAEVIYPWCARYTGSFGNSENCGFVNLGQCRATISGVGGYCVRNPMWIARHDRPRKKRVYRH